MAVTLDLEIKSEGYSQVFGFHFSDGVLWRSVLAKYEIICGTGSSQPC